MKKYNVTLFLIFVGYSLNFIYPVNAQDSNILHPIADIEKRLMYEPYEIFRFKDSRFKGDVTKRVIMKWPDGVHMQVKWKKAPIGGRAVNNEPRYEIAAYKLQKLFLEPENFVVPPTIVRCISLEQYRTIEQGVAPTFKNCDSVFFVLQYWLENVTSKKIYNKKLFKSNDTYARHLGNMNILSYLIKHSDSNIGNFLISTDPSNPRVFAVDNGLAFGNLESNRGVEWQKIKVKQLPAETIDRLRKIQLVDLEKALGVVAQFELKNDMMIQVEPGENLNKKKGVRTTDKIVQFGLTEFEIKGVFNRLEKLLKRVDSGKIKMF